MGSDPTTTGTPDKQEVIDLLSQAWAKQDGNISFGQFLNRVTEGTNIGHLTDDRFVSMLRSYVDPAYTPPSAKPVGS